MEKTDRMMYSMATTDPKEWFNYLALLVVCNIPKFKFQTKSLSSLQNPLGRHQSSTLQSPTNQVTMVSPWQQEVTWNPCQKNNQTPGLNTETSSETSGRKNNKTSTPGSSFGMTQCGQNKAKNMLKQKGENDKAMQQMAGEISRVNAEQALMRKSKQWKLYYKMCNKEVDANGKKGKTGTQRSSRYQQQQMRQ